MSYYDWTLEQNAEQYDGLTLHWYFPRTGNTPMTPGDKKLNEDRQEAQRFLELGVVNNQGRFDTQRVQSHLTKVFGKMLSWLVLKAQNQICLMAGVVMTYVLTGSIKQNNQIQPRPFLKALCGLKGQQ